MSAKEIWFGNQDWPSGRSPGDFANDVFKKENCKTDKEKAFAFYKWFIRCMNRGPNFYQASASGNYERCFNSCLLFTGWGSHECTGWGWIASEALNAAGVKSRRVVCHNNGHTIYEVFYKGDDGKEQWHAFDPFLGWYFLNKSGEVASCEELAADSNLAQAPYPGHAEPLGHFWQRSGIAHRHRQEDALDIVQPLQNERLAWNLLPGQEITNLWQPSPPEYALVTYNNAAPGERGRYQPQGSHCSISPYGVKGQLRYPEHEPYWKHYRWPSTIRPNENVRWHGFGNLRWLPLVHGEKVTEKSFNATFENNRLSPSGPNKFMEIWYRFKLPYPANHISLDTDVSGSGTFGLSISADNGNTVWPVFWGSPRYDTFNNGKSQYLNGKSTIQGLREFMLRIDMESRNVITMNALRIMIGYQHNMNVQPRLLPGKNSLYLDTGDVDDGSSISARWNYTMLGKEMQEELGADSSGKVEKTVTLDCDAPDDIVMRGVTLKCSQ